MFCSKCGAQLPDDAVFCTSCGTATANSTPAAQDPAQQPNQNTQQANPNTQSAWNTAQPNQNEQQQNAQANANNWSSAPQQPQSAPAQSSSNPYVMAALAYIPILFWLPLACDKNNAFGRKTANQGLLLLIFGAGSSIVLSILAAIIKGILNAAWLWGVASAVGIIFGLISFAISALALAAWIVGLVKGLKGEFFEVPLIGKITIIK